MSDENFSYVPPGADAAVNTPAPQPWQQRQRLFAESAVALQDTSLENPLRQRLFIQTNFLNSEYAPEIEAIAAHDNWLDRIAKRDIRLGKKTEGIELTVGDVEDVAASVAQKLLELRQNQNIDSFFREKPQEATYLFKLLFSRTIVAKNAANNAGLFVDGIAQSMLNGLDSRYLQPQEHLGTIVDPLAFEGLKSDQKAAMPYALVAIQSLDSLIEDRMVTGSNSLANLTENSKDYIVAKMQEERGLNSAGLTNLSSDIIELPKRIGSNQQIMLDVVGDPNFASTTANSPAAELATPAQTSAEMGQDNTGENPLVQQAAELQIKADENAKAAEAKVAAARAALEAAKAEAANALGLQTTAEKLLGDAQRLDSLRQQALEQAHLLSGLDQDPEVRNAQLDALDVTIHLDTWAEEKRMSYYTELSKLPTEVIARFYELDEEVLRLPHETLKSLMGVVNRGISFSNLTTALEQAHAQLRYIIPIENGAIGRRNLSFAATPLEDYETFQQELGQQLANLKASLGM